MHKPLFAFLFALCSPAVFAASTINVSFDQSTAYTRLNNPDLRAARLRIAEAEGRLLGSGRLSNPEVGLDVKSNRRFNEGTVAISFDQRFPVTARLRLEKTLSRQLVAAAELEVLEQERLIIAEAQALFVRLLSIEEQRVLRDQQVQLSQKLSSFATDRASKGELSPLDAAQAQVDSQRLILESRKLQAEKVTLVGELKPKLGIPATTLLTVTGILRAPVTPEGGTWKGRPDYQLAKVKEDAARTEISLAKARKWDDVTVGTLWEHERTADENTGFLGLRLSLPLPLPLWNRNQGEIAERRASATRATLETKALVVGITNQIEAARAEMAVNAQLVHETRSKLLPLVLEQTDKLEKAYETGQTDLLTLLRARDQRIQLETAVLEATRDFHLARIRYEAAIAKHSSAPSRQAATIKAQSK